MAEDFSLAPGARFSVDYKTGSDSNATLEGVFRGMALIGTETALVFDTDSGRTYLRAAPIICMRQLEAAPEDSKRPAGDDRALYG